MQYIVIQSEEDILNGTCKVACTHDYCISRRYELNHQRGYIAALEDLASKDVKLSDLESYRAIVKRKSNKGE